MRWFMRDKDPDGKKKVEHIEEERKERERVDRVAEEEAIKDLLVFDQDDMEIDSSKNRAISCKHNTNVIPK